jgi:hypothetical protein
MGKIKQCSKNNYNNNHNNRPKQSTDLIIIWRNNKPSQAPTLIINWVQAAALSVGKQPGQ